MYRHFLITLFLGISLIGCTAPAPEETVRDPNVTPEGVRITPDVVYGHKFGMALTFDMYQPKNQNGAGVIWINSGGYRSHFPNLYIQTAEGLRLASDKDLETMTPNMRSQSIKPLLTKGFTVFTVRHGSSPKFGLQEIVSDLRSAVRFVRFHASDYGIDAERLGLWGGSAGGHLALLLATTSETGNSEVNEEFEKGTGRVAAVVAFFPGADLKRAVDFVRQKFPENLKEHPIYDLSDKLLIDLSPIYHISADDPPTLIVHGDKDLSVPIIQGESMYQALQEAGVESKFVVIPGAGHGFEGEDADRASAEAVNWFEEHLAEK